MELIFFVVIGCILFSFYFILGRKWVNVYLRIWGDIECFWMPAFAGMTGCLYNNKKPHPASWKGFLGKKPGDDRLWHGQLHTIIGAKWFHFWVRDGIRWYPLALVARQKLVERKLGPCVSRELSEIHIRLRYFNLYNSSKQLRCYMVKSHGQLVLVSWTHYCAFTPSLSTLWSTTDLEGLTPVRSHLEASFPLRCFQRLSLPNIATRQCHWRDNRNTRGSFTPVLSY